MSIVTLVESRFSDFCIFLPAIGATIMVKVIATRASEGLLADEIATMLGLSTAAVERVMGSQLYGVYMESLVKGASDGTK